ncbi:hypothetical protein OPV22_017594 [Ensete ventricosum]|uniref:Purple acid phosphatase N-terminal domain-containing protein n=1 Tax=Ensete ventricosum TaxID=4639 RepID=A0AAV8QNN2_ENSVE|nr:hypothetical protein OPV22_017594 [Ensete ventricosum]
MDLSSSRSIFGRSVGKLAPLAISLLFFLVLAALIPSTEAYDSLDPNGNITIKWDIMQWTPDGYVAVVTIWKENNPSSDDVESGKLRGRRFTLFSFRSQCFNYKSLTPYGGINDTAMLWGVNPDGPSRQGDGPEPTFPNDTF